MTSADIPWKLINEKEFEEICLYAAEVQMPTMNMDLYIKNGNKQHGIDIKTFKFSNGKNICIQCKHYPTIKLSVLKQLIKEFKEGIYFKNTSRFIVATSADLQKKDLSEYIESQVADFSKKHNIELEFWDENNLRKKLAKSYRLVLRYFGKKIAEDIAFLSTATSNVAYEPIDNYIERKVLKITAEDKLDVQTYAFGAKEAVELKEVFLSDLLTQEDILMKMVWQVLDGFYHLKEASYGDKKTKKVSHLIIENVSKGKLVAYILSNLENGIEADLVFKSHIEFCRHLKVHQAKNALFTQIELNRFKDYEQVHAINIFLELNGEKSKLFSLFKNCVDFNGYQYIELAKVLKENYKNDVANSLSSLLDCDDVTQERKMEVAQLLAEIGWTKGFAFIIDSIVKNAVVPSDLFHVMPVDCLCSQEILNELDKIVHHIFDENSRTANNSRHIPSVKDFLLDCLYKIAQKGEGDLALTEEFLNAAQEKLKSEYPDSKDILFHVDRIVEKTRELDKAHYEILELKELLNNVRM